MFVRIEYFFSRSSSVLLGDPFLSSNNVKFVENEKIFKILADPTRRNILANLCQEPLSVNELVTRLKLSPQLVRYHLSQLDKAGLTEVCERRRCQYAYNVLEKVYKATANMFHFCFGDSSDYLPNFINKVTEVLHKIGISLSSSEENLINEMCYEVTENLDNLIKNIQKLIAEKNERPEIQRSILVNILVKYLFHDSGH